MKGMRRLAAAAGLFLVLAAGGLASMLALQEESLSSRFQTGGVDICLESKMKENGRVKEFVQPRDLVPGQEISMIPVITSRAEDCYIRVQIEVTMDEEGTKPVKMPDFIGMNAAWIEQDPYYYYRYPLAQGQTAELFQGLRVPAAWTDKEASGFDLHITAEAVQSQNWQPDFQKHSPWGSVETEISQIGEYYLAGRGKRTENKGISLVYQGGAKALVSDADSFMAHLSDLMPGDHYSDVMKLKNAGQEKVCIFFKASTEETKLLKQIQLRIESETELFYQGPLTCEKLSDYRMLAELEKKQAEKVKFSIHVPETLTNPYQVLADRVTWYFKVCDEDGNPIQAQTGDERCFGLAILIMAVSAAAGLLIIRRSRR